MISDNIDIKLWVKMDQVNTLIRKARSLELKKCGVTMPEAEVLYILTSVKKELTLAEIAQWNCRELNSVLIRVNKMVKKGLVKKSRSAGGRESQIAITEKGRTLYDNVTFQAIRMIFEVTSKNEKEQLLAFLNKLDERTRELLGMNFRPLFLL